MTPISQDDTTITTTITIAMRLMKYGLLLLFTVLLQASIFQGVPLSQLGHRPIKGRGLFEYIYYGTVMNNIGVWGYDPIQGAFSPLLRFLCHCSLILVLWGGSLYIHTTTITTTTTTTLKSNFYHDDSVLIVGVMVIIAYLMYCYIVFYIRPGVSVPPGPRPHKIQRIPQWYDQYWYHNTNPIQNRNQNSTNDHTKPVLHRYVNGQESHYISEQIHNDGLEKNHPTYRLTGEPAGRDMWTTETTTTTPNTNPTVDVSNDIIQTLASGGRSYTGFNPHINPNRYVVPPVYNKFVFISFSLYFQAH
jgi:hypothetical protein